MSNAAKQGLIVCPVCFQDLEVTVEDHDAGSHPGDAEQHPVEEYRQWVLTEIVHSGGDEISLVSVSVTAKEGSQADQRGEAPDHGDQQFQTPLPGTLVT